MERINQQYNNHFGANCTQTSVIRKDDTLCVMSQADTRQDKEDYYIDDYYGLQLDSN